MNVTNPRAKRNIGMLLIALLPLIGVVLAPFSAGDGDGKLYAKIGTEAVERGFLELFALKWYGTCQIYGPGSIYYDYFFEHPPGLFLVPVIFGKLGIPAEKALYCADLFYQLIALFCIYITVRAYVPRAVAQWSIVGLLLMPISFLYSVRSTQETPLMMSLAIMLAAVVKFSQFPWRSSLALFVGSAFAVALKGPMALPPIMIAIGAAIYLPDFFATSKLLPVRRAITTLGLCMAGSIFAVVVIEIGHWAMTGLSFWLPYWHLQISHRALSVGAKAPSLLSKMSNVPFYLLQIVWFSSPFVLSTAYAIFESRSKLDGGARSEAGIHALWPLMVVLLGGSIAYVLGMSIFDRVSQRYIFPAYYLVGLAGFFVTYGRWPGAFHRVSHRFTVSPLMIAVLFWSSTRLIAIVTNPYLTVHE